MAASSAASRSRRASSRLGVGSPRSRPLDRPRDSIGTSRPCRRFAVRLVPPPMMGQAADQDRPQPVPPLGLRPAAESAKPRWAPETCPGRGPTAPPLAAERRPRAPRWPRAGDSRGRRAAPGRVPRDRPGAPPRSRPPDPAADILASGYRPFADPGCSIHRLDVRPSRIIENAGNVSIEWTFRSFSGDRRRNSQHFRPSRVRLDREAALGVVEAPSRMASGAEGRPHSTTCRRRHAMGATSSHGRREWTAIAMLATGLWLAGPAQRRPVHRDRQLRRQPLGRGELLRGDRRGLAAGVAGLRHRRGSPTA